MIYRLCTGANLQAGTPSAPEALSVASDSSQRLSQRIVADGFDKSDLEGAGAGHFFGSDEEFQCSSLPDQPREALRPTPTGHQAKRGAAMSEDRMRRSNPPMTSERQIESPTHAMSFNGRDHRRRVALDGVHQGLAEARELQCLGPAQMANLIEIRSCREVSLPGDDQRQNRSVAGSHIPNFFLKGNDSLARETVHSVLRDEPQEEDASIARQSEAD